MTSKILINAVDPEEVRLAIVKESRLEEFHIESSTREILHSSIYKGVITRIEPSLQAVFVDFGATGTASCKSRRSTATIFRIRPRQATASKISSGAVRSWWCKSPRTPS